MLNFLSTSGGILPCAGLGVELNDPYESLLTQDIFFNFNSLLIICWDVSRSTLNQSCL